MYYMELHPHIKNIIISCNSPYYLIDITIVSQVRHCTLNNALTGISNDFFLILKLSFNIIKFEQAHAKSMVMVNIS